METDHKSETNTSATAPDMTTAEIERITTEIVLSRLSPGERQSHFGFMYSDFKTRYPGLFEMCCKMRTSQDIANLKFMLNRKKEMEGGMSQYDASVKVGTLLYSQYVKPKEKNMK